MIRVVAMTIAMAIGAALAFEANAACVAGAAGCGAGFHGAGAGARGVGVTHLGTVGAGYHGAGAGARGVGVTHRGVGVGAPGAPRRVY